MQYTRVGRVFDPRGGSRLLTIRAAQMQVFAAQRSQQFYVELLRRISEKYPDEYAHLTESGMREFVERQIAAALEIGLSREGHVGLYVELAVEFGERFDRSPESGRIRKLLAHPTLPGEAKLQGIHGLLLESTGGRKMRVCR